MFILACAAAIALTQDSPAPEPPTVALPPEVLSQEPPRISPKLDLTESPARAPRPLEERAESGPSLGGFLFASTGVLALLGGGLWLLRRYGRNSPLLGGGNPIRLLARRPLGQKQEILLVEVGAKVFMVGSTREHLTTLGELDGPDELAVLRANLPERKDESLRLSFRESLREGIKEEEAPREERLYASIAGELAEIRKTVHAWKA